MRDALVSSHDAKSKAAIRAEYIDRLENYKLEARKRQQRREDLVKDKKKQLIVGSTKVSTLKPTG